MIDATGDERVLFVWPFSFQDVERSLHQFS
jgi:hypothetical protein